jgi:hypothetical protein
MSYRRDTEGRRAWRLWVDQHRDSLLRCSLPEFIFSDEPRWFRFVEHDGWDQESGWGISMLSPDQASALHDFLAGEYGSGEYRHLLRLLDESRRMTRPPGDADPSGTDHPR